MGKLINCISLILNLLVSTTSYVEKEGDIPEELGTANSC